MFGGGIEQKFTAFTSAVGKTMTPEVIPEAFYFLEANICILGRC